MSESQVQQENTSNQEEKALQDMTPQELLQYAERLKKDYDKLSQKHVKYGLVWEDHDEDVVKECRENLPVLQEVTERFVEGAIKELPKLEGKQLDAFDAANIVEVQNDADVENDTETLPTENINHILIEGDNYHALSVLNYTHKGKIDVIYIDPPYNTGNNDFIYNDRFVDKQDSYRHSKWISFMGKRLKLAKDLLSERGVIFISIDDNEVANLRLLCDKIFGGDNFIADVIWNSRKSVSNDTIISLNHNHTLFYAQNIDYIQKNKTDFRLFARNDKFENPDNDPKGSWVADPFDAPNLRPNLTYPITNPNTSIEYLPPKGRCWRTTKEEYERYFKEGRIVFGKNGKSKPQLKRYFTDAENKGIVAKSIWDDIGTTTNGTQELEKILGEKAFNNPKPLSLINRVLQIGSIKKSIILDFFAGSGTTAHAVMQLNAEDGGNRQCILVTNNENNICEEVTFERCKRVIEGYTNLKGEQVQGLAGNNLRYFKTDFVPYTLNADQLRFSITGKCTEMLCLRENVFDLYIESNAYKIFKGGNKYVAIFYDMFSTELFQLRDVMNGIEGEKVLYFFSLDREPNIAEFSDWNATKIEPIPQKILDLYKQLFRERKG